MAKGPSAIRRTVQLGCTLSRRSLAPTRFDVRRLRWGREMQSGVGKYIILTQTYFTDLGWGDGVFQNGIHWRVGVAPKWSGAEDAGKVGPHPTPTNHTTINPRGERKKKIMPSKHAYEKISIRAHHHASIKKDNVRKASSNFSYAKGLLRNAPSKYVDRDI